MSHINELNFYATPEHDCSYIKGKQAKTVFVDPKTEIDQGVYSELSQIGFRRSGAHIYRPHCEGCQSCVSIRVPVATFTATRSQRRILNKNKDVSISKVVLSFKDEYYDLYARYIEQRHADGDMYPPDPAQFNSFLVDSKQDSYFYEFRLDNNQLIAVALVDDLDDGISAVYTFYEPSMANRSLGSFAILWQIQEAQKMQCDYLYLGYWVQECNKMNYKTNYRPMELLINGRWLKAI